MVRPALVGVVAPLLFAGWPAVAGLRAPISGATPVLPPRFMPMRFEVLASHGPISGAMPVLPPRFVPMRFEVEPRAPTAGAMSVLRPGLEPMHSKVARPLPSAAPQRETATDEAPTPSSPAVWAFPLVDRPLSPTEKAMPLAQELTDAMARIEPMYDPSRLDGTGLAPAMSVSAGTAAMNNVFADRWRRADPDPNVDAKVPATAMAWQDAGVRPCDAFSKNRMHGWDDPGLTALTPQDCRALIRYESRGPGDEPPVPVVAAWISVPVFAAPLPGSRMSSEAFWAARRARIAEVEARMKQRWTAGGMPVTEVRAER